MIKAASTDPNYRPIGTYEDILSILARSEQRRYVRAGIAAPKKNAFIRWVGDPILNALGIAMTWLAGILGASVMIRAHDKIMGALAGPARGPFNPSTQELNAAQALMARVEKRTGVHPAVLCLMSHPPVLPESLGLNVEMARQALLALHSLEPGRAHAKILLAVDAYALDMLEAVQGGLYAGFMGIYHLGLDRLIQHRLGMSRWLMGGTAWWRLPWKASRFLSRGGRLGVVLSGGVPITARVLYTSREFLWRLRRAKKSGIHPREAAQRLEREEREFAEFCRSDLIGPGLRRSAWRLMEAWIVARLSGQWPPGRRGATDKDLAQGRLSEEQVHYLQACAKAMGYSEKSSRGFVRDLQEEYVRDTPYRERFFRFLLGRVLSRGRPLVLLPLSHRVGESGQAHAMKLAWGSPVALLGCEGRLLKVCSVPGFLEETVPLERFVREFVTSHYT